MKVDFRLLKKIAGEYFNLLNAKEDEREVVEQVRGSIAFRGTNLWILIFAIFIASLGLNVNSTAVIIGAMLISPLMGPIIGMGLSVGISDFDLLKQSLKNYGVATLISVVTATLYFFISPLSEARSELLARTTPTLYDVLIAFCGGAAGVLALTTKNKGQVIPGVAIATALMPPLCTAGYGLATLQLNYFFGAFYLFFINTVFIALSTFLGVKLLRFHSNSTVSPDTARRGKRLVTVVVIVTMLPAVVMTVNIVHRNVFERNVHQFVDRELSQNGTRILTQVVESDTLRVVAVGRTISDTEVDNARGRMDYYGLGGYGLEVIQGTDSEELEVLAAQFSSQTVAAESRVAILERQLEAYSRYDTLSRQVTDEAMRLFPEVSQVAVGRVGSTLMALVDMGGQMPQGERDKLDAWLRIRVQDSKLEVVYR